MKKPYFPAVQSFKVWLNAQPKRQIVGVGCDARHDALSNWLKSQHGMQAPYVGASIDIPWRAGRGNWSPNYPMPPAVYKLPGWADRFARACDTWAMVKAGHFKHHAATQINAETARLILRMVL